MSHITPKFAFSWIKKTSLTGKIRRPIDNKRRLQDGLKKYLYCKECEEIFSRDEKHFFEVFFQPYVGGHKKEFLCDEQLTRFIIGLAYRTLQDEIESVSKNNTNMGSHLEKALEEWRLFLLGIKDGVSSQCHMFLLDFTAEHSSDWNDRINWYFNRAIDGTIVHNKNRCILYNLLPKIMLVTTICPNRLPEWEGTLVTKGITIKSPQKIGDSEFYYFLQSRSSFILKARIPDNQENKVLDDILKSIDSASKEKLLYYKQLFGR